MLNRQKLVTLIGGLAVFGLAALQAGSAFAEGRVSGLADENIAVIRGSDASSGVNDERPASDGLAARDNAAVAIDLGSSEEPPPPGSYEPLWGTAPETGERCVDLVYRSDVPPDSPLSLEWELRTTVMVDEALAGGSAQGLCRPEDAPAPTTPTLAANDFVRRLPLPEPQLRIDPGFALTGLPAYLVIEDQTTFTVTEDLAGWGSMRVDFQPLRFEVDWGDGTEETVADGRTGAAHDGDPAQQITHTYRWSDPDTAVTVRSDWQAQWEVGGFSGTVDGLTIDAVLDLPVREYRSVRTDR